MKTLSLLLTLYIVTGASGLQAQPKKLAGDIQTMKQSGKYVFVEAEADNEALAEQNGRQKLVQLIKLQYGVPENAGTKRVSDNLEDFKPVSKAGSGIVTQKFAWSEKKKFRVVVYTEKSVARTIAISAATSAFRDDEEFVFGEFTDRDATRAANEAKGNLIAQIQQRVEADRTVSTEENRSTTTGGKTVTTESESFKSQSRVLSRMNLQGLKTISLNLEGESYVFAYVTKPDIEKSFEAVKTKILALAGDGEQHLADGNIGLALSSYYRGYIYCDAHYTTLPYTFKDGKRTQDVRSALENRLSALVDSIQLTAAPAYDIDERQVVVPVSASFRGKPVPGIGYVLEYGSYTAAGPIATSGSLIELTNFTPESRITVLRPRMVIDIQEYVKTDPTLAELAPSRILAVSKELAVDFGNLYKVGLTAEFNNLSVKFSIQPRFENMIRLVKWDFGDGASDTRANLYVNHTFDDPGAYKVVLTVNNDPALKEVRYVDLKNKRLRMTPPPACSDCEKVETPVQTVVKIKPAYEELSGIRTTQGLLKTIKTLSDRGRIVFGKQSTIGDAEGALVMVVDQQNVIDQLIFSGNRYFQMSTNEPVTNLSERYKGKSLIWIKQL
jgi:hypothetical protein